MERINAPVGHGETLKGLPQAQEKRPASGVHRSTPAPGSHGRAGRADRENRPGLPMLTAATPRRRSRSVPHVPDERREAPTRSRSIRWATAVLALVPREAPPWSSVLR